MLASPFEHRSQPETAAFLRTVARHLWLEAMTKERRRPLTLEPDAAERAWLVFDGEDGGTSDLEFLRECLRRLSGRPADVIRLRYREWLGRAAIACADAGAAETDAVGAAKTNPDPDRLADSTDIRPAFRREAGRPGDAHACARPRGVLPWTHGS